MGMFDNITCEYPLPGNPPEGLTYQTKDTEAQMLEHYRITAGGTLQRKEILRYEDHSDPNAKGIAKMLGAMCPVYGGWVGVPYHGYLTFYHFFNEDKKWLEYQADFVHGQLVGIEQIKTRGEQQI